MIALALAAALFAADGAAAGSTAPAPKVNKDGLVCKKEAVVGSKMPTKVCLTAEEWAERTRASREAMQNAQRVSKPLSGN